MPEPPPATRHPVHRRGGEDGATLVLVLVFVTALSLVIGSLLFGTATAQKTTVVITDLEKAVYAADAGVEYGIEQLRDYGGVCPTVGNKKVLLPKGFAGGQNVTVTCDAGGASTPQGITNYAIVTLEPGTGSFIATQAALADKNQKQVSGPTYVSGMFGEPPEGLKSQVRFNASAPNPASPSYPVGDGLGEVYQAQYRQVSDGRTTLGLKDVTSASANFSSSDVGVRIEGPGIPAGTTIASITDRSTVKLSAPATAGGSGLTLKVFPPVACGAKPANVITANFSSCTAMPAPDPKPDLPVRPSLYTGPIPHKDDGTCAIFLPGTYTTSIVPKLRQFNYFASGVYYFENVGLMDLGSDKYLFAGEPDVAAGDARALSQGPCATDAQAYAPNPPPNADKGAQFILGGNSSLNVNRVDLEIMAFHPASPGKGSPGVALRTVPRGDPGGYMSSRQADPLDRKWLALQLASGNNPHMSMHGLVYVPNASVALEGTNTSTSEIRAGIVAWRLSLGASASASGFSIRATGDRPLPRSKVVIEATAPVSSAKSIRSRAVVDVDVDLYSRTMSGGATTRDSMVVTSTANGFRNEDLGAAISGTTIRARAYITKVVSASTVEISAPATDPMTGGSLSIDRSTRTFLGNTTNGARNITITTPGFAFVEQDVGAAIRSIDPVLDPPPPPVIPQAAQIAAVTAGTNKAAMSQAATATANGVVINISRQRFTVTVASWRVENP